MDTTNIVYLDPDRDKRVNMFYMKSVVELADSLFQPLSEWQEKYTKEIFQFDKRYEYESPKK